MEIEQEMFIGKKIKEYEGLKVIYECGLFVSRWVLPSQPRRFSKNCH